MNTMQQEFDAVVTHLFTQGRPAKAEDNPDGPGCYYRTPGDNPLSCAVGCRIPDAVYTPEMDEPPSGNVGTGLNSLISRFKDVLPVEIVTYQDMFDSLQTVHDSCMTERDGAFRNDSLVQWVKRVADTYSLTLNLPKGV